MSVIGLLEGRRLRYRLGAPLMTSEAWEAMHASPDQNRGGWYPYERERSITDWSQLWIENPASAGERYRGVNAGTMDPEQYPSLQAWLTAHGGIPANPNIQPDPPVTQNSSAASAAEAARVAAANAAAEAARVAAANAAYDAQARAWAAESARLATLPRDPVIGPAFLPDPGEMPACTGRSGEVTCYDPDSASQGGRADEESHDIALAKPIVLPLLALVAAWMVLK